MGRRFRVDSSSGTVGLPKLLWCHCCIRRALSVALRNTVAAADQQCPVRRDADGGVALAPQRHCLESTRRGVGRWGAVSALTPAVAQSGCRNRFGATAVSAAR